MTSFVLQDWRVNQGYAKSRMVLVLFRVCQWLRLHNRPLFVPMALLYKVLAEWVLGIELPPSTTVGPRLKIFHGVGLVVNPGSIIGSDVTLRHGVTIGNVSKSSGCPVIGDDVEVGAGAVIVGSIHVGVGSHIGANVVLSEDVPPSSRVRPAGVRIIAANQEG